MRGWPHSRRGPRRWPPRSQARAAPSRGAGRFPRQNARQGPRRGRAPARTLCRRGRRACSH
eukprot:1515010-Lingulodinium_polyedra.AAC.1